MKHSCTKLFSLFFSSANMTTCTSAICPRGREHVCSLHADSKNGFHVSCTCSKGYMVDIKDTSRCVGKWHKVIKTPVDVWVSDIG